MYTWPANCLELVLPGISSPIRHYVTSFKDHYSPSLLSIFLSLIRKLWLKKP
jgi:hypothetical protein